MNFFSPTLKTICVYETAQRTQGLSALTNVTAIESYKNLIKIQLQNLNQTSASEYLPNSSFKIAINFNLKISIKHQPHTLGQLQLQNLN